MQAPSQEICIAEYRFLARTLFDSTWSSSKSRCVDANCEKACTLPSLLYMQHYSKSRCVNADCEKGHDRRKGHDSRKATLH